MKYKDLCEIFKNQQSNFSIKNTDPSKYGMGLRDDYYDPKELEMGIEVEKEHTDDPEIAKKIAIDHLKELPDYYTRLVKMEKEGKKDLKELT